MNRRDFILRSGASGAWLACHTDKTLAEVLASYPISFSSTGEEAGHITLTVQVNKPGSKISPALWGIFFEDINFAADGGLYAELVKNRSFEFPDALMGWNKLAAYSPASSVEIMEQDPFHSENPHYLRLVTDGSVPGFGIANEGFRGIGVHAGEDYVFSAQLRAIGSPPAVRIALIGANGNNLADARLETLTPNRWTRLTATLRSTATESMAHLCLYLDSAGALDIDMVSLFPRNTWKGRPGGLRADLAQMLADLRPGFIKFPGGFPTEGRTLASRYQWKQTVGDPVDRAVRMNVWNQMPSHPAPDYFQSFGLGFFEYFLFCEDMGAEPMPLLNCGMSIRDRAPLDQLDPFTQDALDLIEFANGPITSQWGHERSERGHPEPFNLKMIRLGNESTGSDYLERFERIAKAIRTEHPEIELIAGSGPNPAGDNFRFAWEHFGNRQAGVIDEHSHNQPQWFFSSANRYDHYDRSSSKVMVGEYCVHSEPGLFSLVNRSNLETALSEAAFLTGLERNADVVAHSSPCAYLAHVDAWQWKPNLIWFDNLRSYGTPSYYVQQLFSSNRGDVVLPVKLEIPETFIEPRGGMIGFGTRNAQAEFKGFQIARGDRILFSSDYMNGTDGWKLSEGGNWITDFGVLRQKTAHGMQYALLADKYWADCVCTLKARKLAGSEGFAVLFDVRDEKAPFGWYLGSAQNTKHNLEINAVLSQIPGGLELGRWYDIRIELDDVNVRCYLDQTLIHSIQWPVPHIDSIYASATSDTASGEVILKVVNPRSEALKVKVQLEGVTRFAGQASAVVLTSSNLADENTFDSPRKVAPRTIDISAPGPCFSHTFAMHSLSVIRFKVK